MTEPPKVQPPKLRPEDLPSNAQMESLARSLLLEMAQQDDALAEELRRKGVLRDPE